MPQIYRVKRVEKGERVEKVEGEEWVERVEGGKGRIEQFSKKLHVRVVVDFANTVFV